MKTVCLILDGHPGREVIERYLLGVNAHVARFAPETAAEALCAKRIDLAILREDRELSLAPLLQHVPRLVISDSLPPGRHLYRGTDGRVRACGWPLDEAVFLGVTAELLSLSGRRTFRTLLTVTSGASGLPLKGTSVDLSMRGMAFKLDSELRTGERVAISFFPPGTGQRLCLQGRITRVFRDLEDGSTCYGLRFENMGVSAEKVLLDFIGASRGVIS